MSFSHLFLILVGGRFDGAGVVLLIGRFLGGYDLQHIEERVFGRDDRAIHERNVSVSDSRPDQHAADCFIGLYSFFFLGVEDEIDVVDRIGTVGKNPKSSFGGNAICSI